MPDTTVLVMAKEPRPGRVKTRLCPPCTPTEAAALAEAALADTLDAALASGAGRVVLALDGRPGPWCPSGVDVVGQGDGDLGDRLAAAWARVDGPTVQIGMDTPQVTAAHLTRALDAVVADTAARVGPAVDGGWWLLGLRRPVPAAFEGVPWSTAATGAAQVARLRRLGLEVTFDEELRDVDHFPDAVAVAAERPDGRFAHVLAGMTCAS